MEFPDIYRRHPAGVTMQHLNAHQYARPTNMQQNVFWNPQLLAMYQQRTAMMMQQGAIPQQKQTEPKPRLAKDEVELLEREFVKNPKPNSSTKRELAERMGVEVPRINNWFQNRRAKAKQQKKTQEFEAKQAAERAASDSKSPEEQSSGVVTEFYGLTNTHQPLGTSTAAFEDEDGEDDDDENDEDDDGMQFNSHEDDFSALEHSIPASHLPSDARIQSPTTDEAGSLSSVDYESPEAPLRLEMPVPLASPVALTSFETAHLANTFQRPLPSHFGQPHHSLPESGIDGLSAPLQSLEEAPVFATPYQNAEFFVSPVPQFPSQMLQNPASLLHQSDESLSHAQAEDAAVKLEHLSPESLSQSPTMSDDNRFKSPPPVDIASRRNMRRPAPLGLTALRSLSHGPKTGIDIPRRPDAASPMRRISSATGSLSGRIQKSFLGSGPRSPYPLDRSKEAALLQTLHGARSPVLQNINSAFSPVSPEHALGQQNLREATVSSSASEEEQAFAFGSLAGGGYFATEHTIKTPPGTPGIFGNIPEQMFANSVDQAWGYITHDEPLPTPSLGSHGSELEFSMSNSLPNYVASQPVTPSFPPTIGPSYGNYMGPAGTIASEYTFPDSYQVDPSERASPTQAQKQFQFTQNVTPQDFSHTK